MESSAEKLIKLKQKLDEAKENKVRIEGQLTLLTGEMNQFNCSSIEELEKKLKEYENIIIEKQTALEKGIEELENEFN
jgi:hypothetical protein